MTNKKKKIKVLAWCDSPAVATGFATVSRGILDYLAKTGDYDIDVIGINDRGGHKDPKKWLYRIYPARIPVADDSDFFGRPRLIASVLGKDPDLIPPWDIIWTLNDPFILEQQVPVFKKGTLEVLKEIKETIATKLPPEWQYKVISYFPIDSELKENWVSNSIAIADYPVVYTEYGKKMVGDIANLLADEDEAKHKEVKVIPHGFSTKNFHPLDKQDVMEFRREFFNGKVKEKTFLVSAVARNQLRKDLPRTMKIFKEFSRRRPQSFLYLHSQEQDAWGSLREYARSLGLEYGKDWGVPASFSANQGFPIEAVNFVYNASDLIISTSLGEGLGFYNLESFAAGTPVMAPANTSHIELFGLQEFSDITNMDAQYESGVRGIPILSGSNTSEWATYGPQDYERFRPLVNVDDGVKKMMWVYENRDKAKEIAKRAQDWVKDYTWDKVGARWDALFHEVYDKLTDERKELAKKQESLKTKDGSKKKV